MQPASHHASRYFANLRHAIMFRCTCRCFTWRLLAHRGRQLSADGGGGGAGSQMWIQESVFIFSSEGSWTALWSGWSRSSCWLLPSPTLYLRYQTQRTLQRGLDRADHRYELPGAPTPAMPDLGDQKNKKTKQKKQKATGPSLTTFDFLLCFLLRGSDACGGSRSDLPLEKGRVPPE